MIDAEKLNDDLAEITDLRNELESLSYSDENYDEVEDALHELEDEFVEDFGDYLDDVLIQAHEMVGTLAEVLLPTAYIPKSLEINKEKNGEMIYHLDEEDGVYVKIDAFPSFNTRIVLVPNPARLLFTLNGEVEQELWRVE